MQGFGLDSHKENWAEESTRVGDNLGPGQRELVPKKRSLYPRPPSSPRQTKPGWCQRPGRTASPSSCLWSLYQPLPCKVSWSRSQPSGKRTERGLWFAPTWGNLHTSFLWGPGSAVTTRNSRGCWALQRKVLGPIPPPLELLAPGWAGSDPGLYLHPPIPS